MIQLFLIAIFFILGSALFIYRYTGKKRLLKFDLVQFIYAFIIAPLVFVWIKTFVFYLVQAEPHRLSQSELFAIDTGVSLLGLFVYSFVIIHFLTKNFEIKRYRDPLYDIFQLSEVIHLWISHLGVYFGLMLLLSLVSILNIFFPLQTELSRWIFILFLPLGFLLGLVFFIAIWLSNFTKSRFIKINKLMFAFFLFVLLSAYFLLEVKFESAYSAYWFFLSSCFGTNLLSISVERSQKVMKKLEKWHHKYEDGWSGFMNRFQHPS